MVTKSPHTDTIKKIETFAKCFLLGMQTDITGKDVYLRNSIAKAVSLVKVIDILYITKKYNEGWIVHRALVDRLVYLYYLTDNDKFKEFDEWTYIEAYEHRHNAKTDERFKRVLNNPMFKNKAGEGNTYNEFKEKKINWTKPDPFQVLKGKGLDFIYKFGYDYASMHTHPMAWDGEMEFHQLTGLEPDPYKAIDHTHLINNSLLVCSLILNFCVSNMSIPIHDVVIAFLAELKKLSLGQENTFEQKLTELWSFYKAKAGY